MKTRLYMPVVFGAALLLTYGCSDKDKKNNDVPPAKNPETVLEKPASPPERAEDDARVKKSEVIPTEYTLAGDAAPVKMTVATILPTEGNKTSGLIAFIQARADDKKLRVVGKLINVPAGTHGFHIHEVGNCMSPDASSAGAHFNPTGTMHGDRESVMRHAGDLGNFVASTDETATFDFYDPQISFNGVNSIFGKAVIVHAAADDATTQPSGNSGARIACGVINNG